MRKRTDYYRRYNYEHSDARRWQRLLPKLKVYALFGSKCANCGYSDVRALQLDHINRATEPRNSPRRSGRGLFCSILRGERNLSEFQLLCANCNWIKKLENGEHKPVGYKPEAQSHKDE